MDATRADAIAKHFAARRYSRRAVLAAGGAGAVTAALGRGGRLARAAQDAPHGTPAATPPAVASTGASGDRAAAIVAMAREAMAQNDLKAVILRVTIDGQEVITS